MSAWVTFKDEHDITHVVLRESVHRSPYGEREVMVDGDQGLMQLIQTQLTYDEIMGS